MDDAAVGDRLANSDALTAVANEAVLVAVAERRRAAHSDDVPVGAQLARGSLLVAHEAVRRAEDAPVVHRKAVPALHGDVALVPRDDADNEQCPITQQQRVHDALHRPAQDDSQHGEKGIKA